MTALVTGDKVECYELQRNREEEKDIDLGISK